MRALGRAFAAALVVSAIATSSGQAGAQTNATVRACESQVVDSDPSTPTPPGAPSDPVDPTGAGYWMIDADGRVYPFGAAPDLGDVFPGEAVKLGSTPTVGGYWILLASGAVRAFGDAGDFGDASTAGFLAGERIATLSATPTGQGYWIFSDRGRVQAFGDATFFGDLVDLGLAPVLNGPVVDSVALPDGSGYYMVATDGGVFAFGAAEFRGSMGGQPLNSPVNGLVPDPDGVGYWLVAGDGGVFAFEAGFRGAMGSTPLNGPVVGMVAFGGGYLMVANDGGIFNFSDDPFLGSLGGQNIPSPIIAVAPLGGGVSAAGSELSTAAAADTGIEAAGVQDVSLPERIDGTIELGEVDELRLSLSEGDRVSIDRLDATSFADHMRLIAPSGVIVFRQTDLRDATFEATETGTYRLQIYDDGNEPDAGRAESNARTFDYQVIISRS